jgi:hypothetical protein
MIQMTSRNSARLSCGTVARGLLLPPACERRAGGPSDDRNGRLPRVRWRTIGARLATASLEERRPRSRCPFHAKRQPVPPQASECCFARQAKRRTSGGWEPGGRRGSVFAAARTVSLRGHGCGWYVGASAVPGREFDPDPGRGYVACKPEREREDDDLAILTVIEVQRDTVNVSSPHVTEPRALVDRPSIADAEFPVPVIRDKYSEREALHVTVVVLPVDPTNPWSAPIFVDAAKSGEDPQRVRHGRSVRPTHHSSTAVSRRNRRTSAHEVRGITGPIVGRRYGPVSFSVVRPSRSSGRNGWPYSGHASFRHSQSWSGPPRASVAGCPHVGQSGGVVTPRVLAQACALRENRHSGSCPVGWSARRGGA